MCTPYEHTKPKCDIATVCQLPPHSMIPLMQDYLHQVLSLVSSTQIPFNDNLQATLPTTGGVYRVFELASDWSSSIYLGKTGNLRNRIYHDLLMGNRQAHTLKSKLILAEQFPDRASVEHYLQEECSVQFHLVPDETQRSLFEHFAIALLKPRFND